MTFRAGIGITLARGRSRPGELLWRGAEPRSQAALRSLPLSPTTSSMKCTRRSRLELARVAREHGLSSADSNELDLAARARSPERAVKENAGFPQDARSGMSPFWGTRYIDRGDVVGHWGDCGSLASRLTTGETGERPGMRGRFLSGPPRARSLPTTRARGGPGIYDACAPLGAVRPDPLCGHWGWPGRVIDPRSPWHTRIGMVYVLHAMNARLLRAHRP